MEAAAKEHTSDIQNDEGARESLEQEAVLFRSSREENLRRLEGWVSKSVWSNLPLWKYRARKCHPKTIAYRIVSHLAVLYHIPETRVLHVG